MQKLFFVLIFIASCTPLKHNKDLSFTTTFEDSHGTETRTYQEIINHYRFLAENYEEISIDSIGTTDSGKPLHLVTLNADAVFDFDEIRQNKRVLLINDGIHPGESDGIDATLLLFRDIAQGKIEAPHNTVLVTIPVYNIGGSLNRNSTTRTNQNGPKEYGFRGNARNFDLNRDFIKSDSKNARTFAKIFHQVQPDVFIDNHVSNGADYQYTLTHLFTQHNKLSGRLGNYLHTIIQPGLEQKLAEKKWNITPYVNVFNQVPEKGFSQFMDTPRYSTGYTSLFNTIGMMVETHMLKPYKQRVEGTYELMKSMIEIVEENHDNIKKVRFDYNQELIAKGTYPLSWKIDTTRSTKLDFKGYEGQYLTSKITGKQRLKYNRDNPFIKEINYQNFYKPSVEVVIPTAYIIPQGWWNVIDLLRLNNVKMHQLQSDSLIEVESYKIDEFETRDMAYEGHYLHYNTTVKSSNSKIMFRKGDFIIDTDQYAFRYLMATLEPQAPDSFFNWNYFDPILQQKEGFSPYVWEDMAETILAENQELKMQFNLKKANDGAFATNWYAQLDWILKQSDNYEKAHLQYPVYRVKYSEFKNKSFREPI